MKELNKNSIILPFGDMQDKVHNPSIPNTNVCVLYVINTSRSKFLWHNIGDLMRSRVSDIFDD